MVKLGKFVASKTNFTQMIPFIVVVIFLSFFFTCNNSNDYDNYKNTFKGQTFGLATRIEHFNKTSSLMYYFYSEKRILSYVSLRGYEGDEYQLVNKFYKVKYDLNNPEENYIILDEEFRPDSIALVKAGFTKIKYYIYDGGVTCKYIEKSKWK